MRKVEEFEQTQTSERSRGWRSDDNLGVHRDSDLARDTKDTGSDVVDDSTLCMDGPSSATSSSNRDATMQSLHRALSAARAQRAHEQGEGSVMGPSTTALATSAPLHLQTAPIDNLERSDSAPAWSASEQETWTSLSVPAHIPFDFGFENEFQAGPAGFQSPPLDIVSRSASADGFVSPPVLDWSNTIQTPTGPVQGSEHVGLPMATSAYLSHYSNSRRSSGSESLANTFQAFALEGSPASRPPMPYLPSSDSIKRIEGEIDIAGRRKRPRPAPLGQSAVRSRSSGALTTLSPTVRSSSSIASPLTLRHVKSTGHSLNTRYAGIRKTSSAQRSPLNFATFAEAENFHALINQQSMASLSSEAAMAETPVPFISQHFDFPDGEPTLSPHTTVPEFEGYVHMPGPTPMTHLHPALSSPPITPFTTEFMIPTYPGHMMPPVSAPPQFAHFPEFTPPYSAGPLTSSSWSEAALPSPDYPIFPPVTQIPSVSFPNHPFSEGVFAIPHMIIPTDQHSTEPTMLQPEKKTEFVHHEFPGQKDNLANVAQQLPQSGRPKDFVWTNQTKNDFRGDSTSGT